MKKTMFITSVIMVVVMAIALTTSSLAWFSAAGSNVVTTSALTISAKAESFGGIQFLQGNGAVTPATGSWLSSLDLAGANTNLMPLVPRCNNDTLTAALVEGALGASDATGYERFIGNKINSNGNFTGEGNDETGDSLIYHDGYFADDFYVTNLSTTKSIKVKAEINFFASGTGNNTTPTAYTSSTTGYATDATLWVAVLMKKQAVITESGSSYWTDPESDNKWEVVAINGSKGGDVLKAGKADTRFAAGQAFASATDGIDVSGLRDGATGSDVVLGTFSNDAGFGGVGHVMVIAWYDGTTLHANNTGTSIDFKVTFTGVDQNS